MAKVCRKSGNGNENKHGGGGDKGGGGGIFKGNCNHCGKTGHMAYNCFENPESSEYKGDSKKETAAGSVEMLVPNIEIQQGVEFILSSVEQELENEQGEFGTGIDHDVNHARCRPYRWK